MIKIPYSINEEDVKIRSQKKQKKKETQPLNVDLIDDINWRSNSQVTQAIQADRSIDCTENE